MNPVGKGNVRVTIQAFKQQDRLFSVPHFLPTSDLQRFTKQLHFSGIKMVITYCISYLEIAVIKKA